MKKIITILLMLIFTSITKASTLDSLGSTIKQVATETKQVIKETANNVDTSSTFRLIYTDAKDAIKGLASALKIGAEHVYEVLVKQQIVYAIVWLITFVVSLIFIINFFKALKSSEKWGDGSDIYLLGVVRVFQGIIFIIILIISIFHFDTIVTGFVNPEYGALTDIMNFVSKIKTK